MLERYAKGTDEWRVVLIASLTWLTVLVLPANAAEDGCAPIRALGNKLDAVAKERVIETVIFPSGNTLSAGELIIINNKEYWRRGKEAWTVSPREPFPMSKISNCELSGEESIGATQTYVYEYDRQLGYGKVRVRIWVSKDTGLPLKSSFKDIKPNAASFERSFTFSFADDIRDPI
ncbi:outer membrane lipoprotein-sorting protein [Ensifer aridi]|uniref:outer membrane lipoprotein-sorting protein n=1 Tax=Ensifer aridi TaxID=1708715 RepID=UPI001FCD3518|nr:outer membrane lipoprotein-sorting protein [Ensifer aridi]